ncbi:response regulator [Nocardiopsis flavescens]|uniref:DNA-binding response regulator, NarL/FixJ family, contains REC and HTH domains n=1 Tax=Nocardiopsis flavescens TaxID=758803 RepID=A0A1M6QSQ5_9ACTN|nr:response regulator transcription factor [Nocardiopsis flavescens]SHK23312.1 DNA-binding response regulator, NarL/FixJ family, contains REC and HTH domains [Nocardiopsis flavescens]
MRVLIVDDQVLLRHGLRKLLEFEDGVEVAGDVGDGLEALDFLAGAAGRGALPDVALVDARMPRMDGLSLIGRMRREYPDVPAIVLTTFDDDDVIFGCLRAGARGHLLKDVPPEELVSALRRVARGETVLGAAAAERLVASLGASGEPVPEPDGGAAGPRSGGGSGAAAESPLSDREWEVARMIGRGATNREIARGLFITDGTTRNHVTNILRKLGLRDRTRLALWVRERDAGEGRRDA